MSNHPQRDGERMRGVHGAQIVNGNRSGNQCNNHSPRKAEHLICFKCRGKGDTARYCTRRAGIYDRQPRPAEGRRSPTKRCFKCRSSQHLFHDCPNVQNTENNKTQVTDTVGIHTCLLSTCVAPASVVMSGFDSAMCTTRTAEPRDTEYSDDANNSTEWEFGLYPLTDAVNNAVSVNSTIGNFKISALPISDIEIQGSLCRSMNDSGAEVPLISDQLVSKLDVEVCGHINMRGVIGE